VIPAEHDEGVSGGDASAHRAGHHFICRAHIARELDVHVGFVLLNVVEVEVSEVVDRVV